MMCRVKQPKRLCACGCGNDVSASAERRHLAGAGPKQVAASMLEEWKFLLGKGPGEKGKSKHQSVQRLQPQVFPLAGPSGIVSPEGADQPIDRTMDIDDISDGYCDV